jgi:hypothetical protein
MAIQQSGLRPASFPSPPLTRRTPYQSGALRAQRFLRLAQRSMSRHRVFQPALLRETLDYVLCARSLEGCQLNPDTWDALAAVERR